MEEKTCQLVFTENENIEDMFSEEGLLKSWGMIKEFYKYALLWFNLIFLVSYILIVIWGYKRDLKDSINFKRMKKNRFYIPAYILILLTIILSACACNPDEEEDQIVKDDLEESL